MGLVLMSNKEGYLNYLKKRIEIISIVIGILNKNIKLDKLNKKQYKLFLKKYLKYEKGIRNLIDVINEEASDSIKTKFDENDFRIYDLMKIDINENYILFKLDVLGEIYNKISGKSFLGSFVLLNDLSALNKVEFDLIEGNHFNPNLKYETYAKENNSREIIKNSYNLVGLHKIISKRFLFENEDEIDKKIYEIAEFFLVSNIELFTQKMIDQIRINGKEHILNNFLDI